MRAEKKGSLYQRRIIYRKRGPSSGGVKFGKGRHIMEGLSFGGRQDRGGREKKKKTPYKHFLPQKEIGRGGTY